MIGYDFDDTIYEGNSYRHFYFFCLWRFPYIALYLPVQFVFLLLYACHLISKDVLMRIFCFFIVFIPHKEKRVRKFWDKNLSKIKPWYMEKQTEDDLIVSASPRYLVEEACRRINIRNVIATEMNLNNGKINGKHCYGEEKVLRYKSMFGAAPLKEFYSDSHTDIPMFALAEKGYFVEGDEIYLVYENGVQTREIKGKKKRKTNRF